MARQFICRKDYPIVETKEGKLHGFLLDGIFNFYGVKYAEAKRFHQPTPVQPWEGVKDATTYGATCPNTWDSLPKGELRTPHRYWPQDEDCLNLNIWTKSLDPDAKKPVIVWIHGGAYAAGSALEMVAYEGDALTEYGDVVTVTLNHRLNILGFFDLSSFGEEYANSANVGLADLVAALQWIHNNIAAFGGDPENVTIFGQSGGGGKVCNLLQIPAADGLFHKAYMMSGGCMSPGPHNILPHPDHGAVAKEMLKILGYDEDDIKKLETIPYSTLTKVFDRACKHLKTFIFWGPTANDYYLGHPQQIGFTEQAKKIPTMVSSVFGEFAAFSESPFDGLPEDEKYKAIVEKSNGHGEELLAAYRSCFPDRDLADITRYDASTRIGVIDFLKARAASGAETPAFGYFFDVDFEIEDGTPAWHCSDIPFMFHNAYRVACCNMEGFSDRLEDEMAGSLVAFARTGDPNHAGMSHWAPYTNDCHATMVFGKNTRCEADFDDDFAHLLWDYGPKFEFHHHFPGSGEEEEERLWL